MGCWLQSLYKIMSLCTTLYIYLSIYAHYQFHIITGTFPVHQYPTHIIIENRQGGIETKIGQQSIYRSHILKYRNIQKMNRLLVAVGFLLLISTSSYKTPVCKLTITTDPDTTPSRTNKTIDLYPTVYSSPVDNLNNHIFTIFKAQPLDACTKITDPDLIKYKQIQSYSYLIAVDGTIGLCGIRRRIQMVKNAGAKGLIVLSDQLDEAIEPYGDYSDNTFLVFVTQKSNHQTLLPNTYLLTSISSPTDVKTYPEFQFWLSTLDTKSYELMAIWDQTIKQIPAVPANLKWRPRYALWGCHAGQFAPGTACLDDSQYLQSCACSGDFCSPQTKYKAADATVKEDIRQKIIYNQHPDKYMPYIVGFKNNCLKTFQTSYFAEDCAASLLMNLGLDYTAIQKKVDEFMSKCSGDIYQVLLLDRNRFSQLGYFPAAILNRQPIQYSNKRDFQVQICKKLSLDQQQGCIKIMKVNTIANFTINVFFFIFIIGGIALIVAVLLLLYRKTIRKQMQKEMKMQVSASVQHYFTLSQSK